MGKDVGKVCETCDFSGFFADSGGDGGIRTLDRALQPYNGLANRRLQPLGHVSGQADMPDTAVSRKRKIKGYATRVTQSPATGSGAIFGRDLAAAAGGTVSSAISAQANPFKA